MALGALISIFPPLPWLEVEAEIDVPGARLILRFSVLGWDWRVIFPAAPELAVVVAILAAFCRVNWGVVRVISPASPWLVVPANSSLTEPTSVIP